MAFEADKIMFEIYRDSMYNKKFRVVYYTELNENNKHAEINRAQAGNSLYDGFIKDYKKEEAKKIIDEIIRKLNEEVVITKEEIIERLQAVIGLLADCMSHDVAFQFIKLGRYIERADMTTRIVDINAAVLVPRQQVPEDPAIGLLWMSVLKSLNAYQSYRRHVSVHVSTVDVVKYLLKDPYFPRTVQHCLDEVEACLAELPHHAAPLKLLRGAHRRLNAMPVESLAPSLRHEYLDAVQSDLAAIHAEIAVEYFQSYEHGEVLRVATSA